MTNISTPARSMNDAVVGLTGLLDGLLRTVPGALGALLASRDGLKITSAGLDGDDSDRLAATVTGMYSLSKGTVNEITRRTGIVQQIIVQHDAACLYVVSAGDQLPWWLSAASVGSTAAAGTVLGLLVEPDTDPSMVGFEMTKLISSAAEYLTTPVRRGDDARAH